MDIEREEFPKVAPSPEVRRVGRRKPNLNWEKQQQRKDNAAWIEAVEKASGVTKEELQKAIRKTRIPKK